MKFVNLNVLLQRYLHSLFPILYLLGFNIRSQLGPTFSQYDLLTGFAIAYSKQNNPATIMILTLHITIVPWFGFVTSRWDLILIVNPSSHTPSIRLYSSTLEWHFSRLTPATI